MDKYVIIEEANQLKSQYENFTPSSDIERQRQKGAIIALDRLLERLVGHCFTCFVGESWEDCMKRYTVSHKEWMEKYSDFDPVGEGTWRQDD